MRKTKSEHIRAAAPQLLLMMTLLLGIVLALGLSRGSATAGQPSPPDTNGIERLVGDTNGAVKISMNSVTGAASFVRLPHDTTLRLPSGGTTPVSVVAEAFFDRYGDAFGITDPESELEYVDSSSNRMGSTQLVYQQVYQDVPVFAAIVKARFDDQNRLTSVNGTFVPKVSLKSTIPGLSVQEAEQIAVQTVAAQNAAKTARLRLESKDAASSSSHDLAALNSDLYVFRSGLVKGVPGRDHLVYEVEVANSTISIREFLYVDAHTGAIVDQITGIYHGLDRDVSESSLANVIWQDSASGPDPIPGGWAGGTAQQVTDWQNEIDGARETYNIFASMANRDSYDGGGATMRTVNNDPGISCPNANWNGLSTNYCSDVTGDDTVAHEWGHAYTQYTNNLIYQYQSGALNESYSDIWGEVVDFLNGRGTDAPIGLRTAGSCSIYGRGSPSVDDSYRWLAGEDDPAFGGAIRDMWDPTCYNDPGKVSDSEYWCEETDNGGVHINSGVPNHAFALLVDGGSYNGQNVGAIGLTKAAHIHWGAQTMLTPASVFTNHADALEASCSSLIGVNLPALSTSTANAGLSGEIVSAADCQEVANAITAVELRMPGCSPVLDPDAPPLCQGLGTVQTISSEDWEGGTLPVGWAVGTHDVANPLTFDTPDWSVVSSLPSGANGTYAAFVPNLAIGDCNTDDESGVLFLDSPPIVIPAGVVPRVAFDHWVATETGWDGGNLKVRINGGPWTLVAPDKFEFNAYNTTLNVDSNSNPLAGEDAFSGSDGSSWGQSQVNLSGVASAGDTVQLRFDFGIDGCTGVTGWYVDDVAVYACSDELPPVCGDGLLDAGESCDDGNSGSGDGCSSACQVENGWSCTDPITPTLGSNVIDDGSFEAGPYGGAWTESSTNFGTPVCDVTGCGTGTGTGPSDGDFWTWFGGIADYEEGSVSQVVTIPATATNLTFDLEQITCDSSADYMEIMVDGSQEFFSDGSSSLCGTLGYTPQIVDLSSYADGAPHMLVFHSEIFANNGAGTNIFVDNIVLDDNLSHPGSPSVCTLDATTHNTTLNPGWNMISTNVQPSDPAVSAVLSGVAGDLVLMKDGAGNVYWPAFSIDQIGSWDVRQGYQIYMDDTATLSVSGAPVDPAQMPITLPAGWNMVAYLRSSALPIDQALDSISLQVYLVKNGDGAVYWPSMAIDEIENMQPGQGYQMYMNSEGTLIYPAN